jgi:hypothetical protein
LVIETSLYYDARSEKIKLKARFQTSLAIQLKETSVSPLERVTLNIMRNGLSNST